MVYVPVEHGDVQWWAFCCIGGSVVARPGERRHPSPGASCPSGVGWGSVGLPVAPAQLALEHVGALLVGVCLGEAVHVVLVLANERVHPRIPCGDIAEED